MPNDRAASPHARGRGAAEVRQQLELAVGAAFASEPETLYRLAADGTGVELSPEALRQRAGWYAGAADAVAAVATQDSMIIRAAADRVIRGITLDAGFFPAGPDDYLTTLRRVVREELSHLRTTLPAHIETRGGRSVLVGEQFDADARRVGRERETQDLAERLRQIVPTIDRMVGRRAQDTHRINAERLHSIVIEDYRQIPDELDRRLHALMRVANSSAWLARLVQQHRPDARTLATAARHALEHRVNAAQEVDVPELELNLALDLPFLGRRARRSDAGHRVLPQHGRGNLASRRGLDGPRERVLHETTIKSGSTTITATPSPVQRPELDAEQSRVHVRVASMVTERVITHSRGREDRVVPILASLDSRTLEFFRIDDVQAASGPIQSRALLRLDQERLVLIGRGKGAEGPGIRILDELITLEARIMARNYTDPATMIRELVVMFEEAHDRLAETLGDDADEPLQGDEAGLLDSFNLGPKVSRALYKAGYLDEARALLDGSLGDLLQETRARLELTDDESRPGGATTDIGDDAGRARANKAASKEKGGDHRTNAGSSKPGIRTRA